MKCKVCGAYNEDYLEYCENCAALLTPDEPEPVADVTESSYVASTGETPPAWGFVRAPQWPKPEFDANTVSEEDIPEPLTASRFNPRPAQAAPTQTTPVQATPVQPAPTAAGYTSGVRPHAPAQQEEPIAYAPPMEEEAPVKPYTPAKQAKQASVQKAAPIQAAAAVGDDLYDDFDDFDEKPARRSSRTRGARKGSMSSRNLLFIAAVAVLVVLIVVFSIIFLNRNYDGSISAFFSSTFGGNPITKQPTIEKSQMDNGDPAYIITVYSKRNYTARFTSGETVREEPMNNHNCVAWRVPEQILIPDEPIEGSELRIKPDIVLISPNGEETPVEFAEDIVIAIPSIDMQITSPIVEDFTTDTAIIPITGTVSDNTAAVYVDGTQIAIDEAGNFSTSYTLPAEGTYSVVIEARKNRYQIASATLNVTYGSGSGSETLPGVVEGNVAFTIDDTVTRYGTASTMTVTGTVEAGATITVAGVELDGVVSQDAAAGTYRFTVKTESAGLYAAVITATKDNAAKSTTLYLEHQPDKTAYMSGVHVLNYERIRDYPNHEQGYKVPGRVVEIYQSEPFVTARIRTADGDIVFSYYSGVSAVATDDGKVYNLYADPAGTYTLPDGSTLPYMHAWFILKDNG